MDNLVRINDAFKNGYIGKEKEIELYLLALENKRLPDEYRSEMKPVKSATTAIHQIREYIRKNPMNRSLTQKARNYLTRLVPTLEKEYISGEGFFRIHYTSEGKHAAEKKYIEAIAEVFDHVKKETCENNGYKRPVREMDSDFYDVYVFDQEGKYGYTASIGYYNKNHGVRIATSYIGLDNSYSSEKGFMYSREDCMKVTAAHEFFHAVQYSYNVDADSWWKEASATWNEDEIYTSVNDYVRYLDTYFKTPEK